MVRPVVLERATTVAWLDYSRARVMPRVIRRSVSRAVTRRELWNGNRENPREWVRAEHPIRYSWANHARKRADYEARFLGPEYAHLEVLRFRTPREATAWLHKI